MLRRTSAMRSGWSWRRGRMSCNSEGSRGWVLGSNWMLRTVGQDVGVAAGREEAFDAPPDVGHAERLVLAEGQDVVQFGRFEGLGLGLKLDVEDRLALVFLILRQDQPLRM